jgi:hypothetical protein
MRRADEAALARRLADALDGRSRATGELAAIVSVLEAAAAEARIEILGDETERALASARPAPRAHPARRPAALAAVAFVVIAASAVVLAWPFGGAGTRDVQAQALAAIGGRSTVLRVVERIVPGPAGGFAASTRSGWIDPTRGLARWTQRTASGVVVDETLDRHGRIIRYAPAAHSAVVASSCRALATGCAAAVDPIAVYRGALLRAPATSARTVRFRGRSAYRFSLPVTELADGTRVVQVVTLDAHTLLPERIEWRAATASGSARTFAVVDIRAVAVYPRGAAPPDAFTLTVPGGTAVRQLAPSGGPVRLRSVTPLPLAGAQALRPPLLWLGRRYGRYPLTGITRFRYTGGDAVLLRYGPIEVWNYGPVIPPRLLQDLAVPVKQFPIGPRTGRLYATVSGRIAIEVDRAGGTVAVTASGRAPEPPIAAVGRLRPITSRPPG